VEHRSELFSLRAELIRKIDDFQRAAIKKGSTKSQENKAKSVQPVITWRGVSYLDICKFEKMESENRLKEEIREELEAKKLKRGTTYSTYNRLMN